MSDILGDSPMLGLEFLLLLVPGWFVAMGACALGLAIALGHMVLPQEIGTATARKAGWMALILWGGLALCLTAVTGDAGWLLDLASHPGDAMLIGLPVVLGGTLVAATRRAP